MERGERDSRGKKRKRAGEFVFFSSCLPFGRALPWRVGAGWLTAEMSPSVLDIPCSPENAGHRTERKGRKKTRKKGETKFICRDAAGA